MPLSFFSVKSFVWYCYLSEIQAFAHMLHSPEQRIWNLLLPSCKEEIGEAFLLSESKDNALNWKTLYLKVQTFYLFLG